MANHPNRSKRAQMLAEIAALKAMLLDACARTDWYYTEETMRYLRGERDALP